jgi:5-methylcytosine-specific restriction endonuclease McrA
MEMRTPKKERLVDKAYLAWIRTRECVVCGAPAPSEPHHVISRGAGGSDHFAIPVCRGCHDLIEDCHWDILSGRYGFDRTAPWVAIVFGVEKYFHERGEDDE